MDERTATKIETNNLKVSYSRARNKSSGRTVALPAQFRPHNSEYHHYIQHGREKKEVHFTSCASHPRSPPNASATIGYGEYHTWGDEDSTSKFSISKEAHRCYSNTLSIGIPRRNAFRRLPFSRHTAQLRLGYTSRVTEPVTYDTTCHLPPMPARRLQKLRYPPEYVKHHHFFGPGSTQTY